MSDRRAKSHQESVDKYGDRLPLQLLEQARAMAADRGWTRQRKRPSEELRDLGRESADLGDDVLVPSPGQEVGSGARPSRRDPRPIGDVLRQTLKARGWSTQLDVASVAARWPNIVGEHVASNCAVEEFDGETLTVRARTVSWETQLRALSAHLEKRLAEELGEGVVKEIIIRGPHQANWKHGKWSVQGRGPRDTYD